jgi:hypothetical protein
MDFRKINNKFYIINNKQKFLLDVSQKYCNLILSSVFDNEFTLVKKKANFEEEYETFIVSSPIFNNKNFLESKKTEITLDFNLQIFGKILFLKKINYKKCSFCNNRSRRNRSNSCKCKPITKINYMANKNDYIKYNDEYYRITRVKLYSIGNIESMVVVKPILKKVFKRTSIFKDNVTICYDFETIGIDTNNTKNHVPYILAYKIFSNNFALNSFVYETDVLFTDPFNKPKDIGKIFVDNIINNKHCLLNRLNNIDDLPNYDYRHSINKNLICNVVTIFGFNNFRFDDNFILKHFYDAGFEVNKFERNGKISGVECKLKNVTIYIKDLIKWVPDMTLKQACDDYNTSVSKLDISIVKYNNLCLSQNKLVTEITLQEFETLLPKTLSFAEKRNLKSSDFYKNDKILIFDYIKYYCKIDVESTLELYLKINNAFIEIYREFNNEYKVELKSLDMLTYISPAFVMSQIYKQIFNNQNIKVLRFKNNLFLNFICDSYFGGKVDFGLIGHYESKNVNDITYMDVSSMYPTVMTSYLPVIYEEDDFIYGFNVHDWQQLIDDTINARNIALQKKELFNFKWLSEFNKRKAILLVDLISPDLEDQIPIAPFPERGLDKLLYNYNNKYNVVVNTSDMKNLILCGFKIKVKYSKFNIEFLKCEKYFKDLLDILDKFKDKAKENNNKAKAKLIKLLSNSISGKLGQKITSRITSYKNYDCSEYDEESINTSLHYIATFITGESRFILFRTIYNLYENCLYNRMTPYQKLGIFILCDTDSIVFDKNNAANLEFIVNDGYGRWDDEKNDYIVHWKQKHVKDNVKSIFCLGRKSYVVCDHNNKIVKRVLKGIHTELMEEISFEDLKSICDDKPKTMLKSSLVRKSLFAFDGQKIFYKEIFEENIKKTLNLNYLTMYVLNDYERFKQENNALYEQCKNNLEKTLFNENINNFLIFVWNKN